MTSTSIHDYTNNEKFQLKITINEVNILSWNYKPDLDSNRPNFKKKWQIFKKQMLTDSLTQNINVNTN